MYTSTFDNYPNDSYQKCFRPHPPNFIYIYNRMFFFQTKMSATKARALVVQVFKERPIIRGVLAYAVIWPTSNLIQQTIQGRRFPNYDWKQAARFCFFGSCVVAPALYGWIRFSSKLWPRSTLKTAIHKAVVEQFTYGPFAICCFLFGMSLLEMKTLEQAADEVRTKFFPTWKVHTMVIELYGSFDNLFIFQVALCVWPVLQTINFRYVSEKNRVPYVSAASLVWTSFLAYMKQLDAKKIKEAKQQKVQNISHSLPQSSQLIW